MSALKQFFFLCILTLSLTVSSASADAVKQDEFLKNLESSSQSINSISSQFTQKSYLSLFQDSIESTGRFTFARPDNLRWEYTTPFVSGFLLKNQQGLKWDEAAADPVPFNTESAPEMAIISEQILAWTTMNIEWLKSRYTIKMISYSPPVMELTPRSSVARDFMNMIKIFFSADSKHLQSIELHEPGGDYTQIIFSEVEINTSLPEGIFEKK